VEQIKTQSSLLGRNVSWLPPGQAADMTLVVCGCMAMCLAAEIGAALSPETHLLGPDHLDYAFCPQPDLVRQVAEYIARLPGQKADRAN
jgi:hypothetical protein